MENYKFFQNKKCEYFPCHEKANCDTFNCLLPHGKSSFDYIMERMPEVINLAKKP